MRTAIVISLSTLLLLTVNMAYAEDDLPKYDASFQISFLDMRGSVGEKPLGVGGRVGYRLSSLLYLDGGISYFPEDPSGNFGETLALGGLRIGKQFDSIGVFAKARTGAIKFGGGAYSLRLSEKTHPAIDLGGVLEYYSRRNLFVRMDLGDCIIPFGNAVYLDPFGSKIRFGTKHNLLAEFGIGIRF